METCTRKITFDAGHRVLGHKGKCRALHGHTYSAYFTVKGPIDELGMIVDFGIIKSKLGNWLEQNMDHGFILYSKDGEAIQAISSTSNYKLFILPQNPTAENIAKYLLEEVCPGLLCDSNVEIVKVRIDETSNCYAEAYKS